MGCRTARPERASFQGAEADVQRGEDAAAECCEQRIHLAGVADAEFHHHSGARGGGDGVSVQLQQGDFPVG